MTQSARLDLYGDVEVDEVEREDDGVAAAEVVAVAERTGVFFADYLKIGVGDDDGLKVIAIL